MADQDQSLQTQLNATDGAVNYLLVLIGGILLSLLAAVRQRDALCRAIRDGTEGPAQGSQFSLRVGSSALIIGALGFFHQQALEDLEAAAGDDPDACRSARRNALAASLVLLAALIRLLDLNTARRARTGTAGEQPSD